MGPIKSSQFAELWLGGEQFPNNIKVFEPNNADLSDTPGTAVNMVKAGIVTSLRIQENLNSAQRNVIGTPVPIFMPGYYSATISADKATLDLRSFKDMVNINPMSAFRTDTYEGGVNKLLLPDDIKKLLTSTATAGASPIFDKIPRFTFILAVKDLVAGAGSTSAVATVPATQTYPPVGPNTGTTSTSATASSGKVSTNIGVYVCMLQSFNVTIASDNSVIMESITMLARPIAGSWFNTLVNYFELSPGLGYDPKLKPQKLTTPKS